MQPLIDLPKQTPPDEIDEEILDIFVEEAKEVLEEIISSHKAWKANLDDTAPLKTLRRNFHTLKGSGRLVGAMVIGELGWKFENLLNRVIEGSIPKTEALFYLLAKVEDLLPDMVEQFREHEPPPHEVILLISQAHYFTETKGQNMGEFEPSTNQTGAAPIASKPSSIPMLTPKESAPVTKSITSLPSTQEEIEEDAEGEEMENGLVEAGDTLELDEGSVEEQKTSDSEQTLAELQFEEMSVTGDEEIRLEEELTTDVPEIRMEEELSAEDFQFGDLEEPVSMRDFSDGNELQFDELSDLESSLAEMSSSEEKSSQLSEATNELDKLSFEFDRPTSPTRAVSDSTDTLFAGEGEGIVDSKLLAVFNKEARQHLTNLNAALTACEKISPIKLDAEIMRAFHTLHGSSLSVGFAHISSLAAPLENYVRTLVERQSELTTDKVSLLHQAIDMIERHLEGRPVKANEQQALINNVQLSLESLKTPAPSATSEEKVPDASDEFLKIFLDEAEEILENTQSLLERWQASPNNMQLMKELQRELHTLKGGARMVGITAMGDLSHSLESVLTRIVEGGAQSNPKLQEIVQNSVDELAAMLEAVRSGVPLETATDLIALINKALDVEEDLTDPTPFKPLPEPILPPDDPELPKPNPDPSLVEDDERIRVRVALIDKLTNLAGELSISRAHLEQQQGSVKNNLGEMEQTVARLRDQLRRLEIETETQILSHFRGPTETQKPADHQEDFDPLELDRFSVMQQLSRSLMETISDLLNIQEAMKILTRQTETLLIQQTRMGAELQDAIMRTRMIPFSRISPRLQRIARLTARELRKQVDFILNGDNTEFERTVLNRIVAPLEHMLRNAIGHGIEDAATRTQSGKPTLAKITVDISKEGSELILKIRDDGAGLDLSAIRHKAEERGLIKSDTVISDYELSQFILEPAFSTAKVVTQISGRGVGMDVVNSEIKQLNGSLLIHSKTGQGTLFEIRLPLSLTINQALLVHIGDETMAVPMNNVDAVMRAPRTEVLSGDTGVILFYKYMGHDYRVYQLSELLGFGKLSIDRPLIPALLVRAADRRVALLVDSIEGSKEIVVKTVGPQIGAIRWIAGATILGDGRVVLILDVPTLTRADPHPIPSLVVPEVVEEKAIVKTIMVVDDSITVRKVTARLLKRQGMEVITAKDGVDAVAQLQEHIPDLMLLDVEMPRMDGYELATQIRNSSEWKHIPIIMITSRTGAKHRDRAEKIGIDRYLGKPFNESELLENINALLSERGG